MIILNNNHNLKGIEAIDACHDTTEYTYIDLKDMVFSLLFILNRLKEINNTTVITTTFSNKEVELKITIIDIKFFHNTLMIYAERSVQKYIREYIQDQIKEFNDIDIYKRIDIRITSDGYGNAIVCHY